MAGIGAVATATGWLVAGPLPKWLIAGVYRRMIPADSGRYVREIGFAASLTAGLDRLASCSIWIAYLADAGPHRQA